MKETDRQGLSKTALSRETPIRAAVLEAYEETQPRRPPASGCS